MTLPDSVAFALIVALCLGYHYARNQRRRR